MVTIPVRQDVYEFVKAEILDPDAIITPGHQFIRYDNFGVRHYIIMDGDTTHVFPSVTAVIHSYEALSFGLKEFYLAHSKEQVKAILEETSNYGTYLHEIFSRLLKGVDFFLTDEWLLSDMAAFYELKGFKTSNQNYLSNLKQDILGFVRFAQDYKLTPIALEYPVYSLKGYAGSLDFVGYVTPPKETERVLAIIDWKSNRNEFYENYEVQLKAYVDAWNEMFPAEQVTRAFSYGCKDYRIPLGKTVTPYRVKDQSEFPNGWKWDMYLDMYKKDHPDKLKNRIEFAPIKVNLQTKFEDAIIEYDPIQQIVETF